uniref:Uncharacterized protein n=1 Tax=Arundo donax TaxID=35708 RepID=A0A0A9BVT2_ARUDO
MKKSRPSAGPGSVCVDKVRVEHPSKVSHVPRAQGPFNHSVHAEEAHGENQSGTLGRTGIQRARHADISSIVEQETAEPPSQIDCAEQVEVESRGNTTRWNQKRTTRVTAGNIQDKNMGSSSSNEEIQITCSKHKQPEGIRHHIQQPTSSSNENRFHPADVDVIIAMLCPSSLPQKQVSQARSNDLDRTDATLPPASINHGTSQGGCFPPGYRQYQAVATGSLADQGLSSAHEHEVSEESSNGIDPHNRSSTQVRLNPSFGVLHRQHIQHYPSHDSQSEQAQVESHSNKIVGHCRNTAKDSMYLSNEGDYIGQPCTGKDQQVTLGQQ